MVDTTKAMESKYVNADLIRNSPTKKCVILNEGEYTQKEYQDKAYEKFELLVEIDYKQKMWAPNKDTIKNIAEEFGKDSAEWVGKIIKLSVGKINGKDTVNGMPIVVQKVTKEDIQ